MTPGEKLLIGSAGSGAWVNRYTGGWGMTYNGDNYSGGGTEAAQHQTNAKPGGGATVVAGSSPGDNVQNGKVIISPAS